MKAAKAWCVAGLFVVTGLSASCGKEEGVGDGDAGTGSILGGNSNAGTAGAGGTRTGGTSGSGTGGSMGVAQTKLGSGCINDGQCADPDAPGLKCVTASDTVLGTGAPPKGVCTVECVLDPDPTVEDPCAALGTGALCYPFVSDTEGYCMEGCAFGEPDIGELKCHDRQEFACNPALLGNLMEPCTTTTEDCGAGELCIEGECHLVFPACLPSCRGDIDCEAGMYCDQSFLSGVCVTEMPTGKPLGEPCTVPADTEPSEPDECLGFCQADTATSTTGHCAATCGLLSQCAWNADTEKFDGACFYASILTSETGFVGDFGFCTPACNCTEECNDPMLACQLLTQGELNETFRGAGLCFSPDPMSEEYNQCAGSMGGAPSGQAGAPAAGGGGAGG